MKEIKLKINYEQDRENMVIALANNGYKAIVINHYPDMIPSQNNYYVQFTVKDDEVLKNKS